jgi:hypothetical protein
MAMVTDTDITIINTLLNMGIGGVIAYFLIRYIATKIDIMNERLDRVAFILEDLKDKLDRLITAKHGR